MNHEFDCYTHSYDAALDRGLVLTGESRKVFDASRIALVKRQLAAFGISPRQAVDFGCGTGDSVPLRNLPRQVGQCQERLVE
jgi:hypothetical protein